VWSIRLVISVTMLVYRRRCNHCVQQYSARQWATLASHIAVSILSMCDKCPAGNSVTSDLPHRNVVWQSVGMDYRCGVYMCITGLWYWTCLHHSTSLDLSAWRCVLVYIIGEALYYAETLCWTGLCEEILNTINKAALLRLWVDLQHIYKDTHLCSCTRNLPHRLVAARSIDVIITTARPMWQISSIGQGRVIYHLRNAL
jgi:hypothetical protein